jgi:hypothetical protein
MQTFLTNSKRILFKQVDANPPLTIKEINEWAREIALKLDNKRLFKQALEGWQILMNLTELDPHGNYRKPAGWSNHPAVKMWRGSEHVLYIYVTAMVQEWLARGYKTTIGEKLLATVQQAKNQGKLGKAIPAWMLDYDLFEEIVSSHRLALLTKNYEHYNQFNWPEDKGYAPSHYDYVWPVKGGKDGNTQGTESSGETSNQSRLESVSV